MIVVILIVCYLKLNVAIAAGQRDFENLRIELLEAYKTSPRLVPLVVRLAFHDLFHQRIVGGRGCIQHKAFLDLKGNAGLVHPINILKQILTKPQLNKAEFKFGDVIAYASKVAVEIAYPCIHIKFKFNRQDCLEQVPIKDESNSIPSSFVVDLKEVQLHLDYLGLDLMEFAVIMAGAHGIQGAQSHNEVSGLFGTFSHVSSGKEYILQTVNNAWNIEQHELGSSFFSGPPLSRLIRLPLEMVLFSNQTFQKLKSLSTANFDQTFAAAFEKMLLIGGGTYDLEDFVQIGAACVDSDKPSDVNPTTSNAMEDETPTAFSNHVRIHHIGRSRLVPVLLALSFLAILF